MAINHKYMNDYDWTNRLCRADEKSLLQPITLIIVDFLGSMISLKTSLYLHKV